MIERLPEVASPTTCGLPAECVEPISIVLETAQRELDEAKVTIAKMEALLRQGLSISPNERARAVYIEAWQREILRQLPHLAKPKR